MKQICSENNVEVQLVEMAHLSLYVSSLWSVINQILTLSLITFTVEMGTTIKGDLFKYM